MLISRHVSALCGKHPFDFNLIRSIWKIITFCKLFVIQIKSLFPKFCISIVQKIKFQNREL